MAGRKWNLAIAPALFLCFAAVPTAGMNKTPEEEARPEKARLGAVVLPVVFNMPETKWGGGVGGLLTYRPAGSKPAARPSSLSFYAVYTQLKQLSTQWEPEAYLREEGYLLRGRIEFERFPEKTWGLGGDAPKEREEDFTSRTLKVEASFQKKIWPARNLYAGLLFQLENYKILESEPRGLLDTEALPGSSGGASSGAGFILDWDSRDNVFFPRRGRHWRFSTVFNLKLLGSDFRYASIILDLRQYVPLSVSRVLAFQALYRAAAGEPPFKSCPKLGGDSIMRGYYSGRYRDKHLLALQAEYRIPVWWRIGLVGFAGLGQVAESTGRLGLKGVKYSAGFGVRFKIAPREGTNLRLDFAWGEGTSGFYLTAGEAF